MLGLMTDRVFRYLIVRFAHHYGPMEEAGYDVPLAQGIRHVPAPTGTHDGLGAIGPVKRTALVSFPMSPVFQSKRLLPRNKNPHTTPENSVTCGVANT
jgi:hypothetical protein